VNPTATISPMGCFTDKPIPHVIGEVLERAQEDNGTDAQAHLDETAAAISAVNGVPLPVGKDRPYPQGARSRLGDRAR